MPLIAWTSTQDTTLANLQAAKDAALAAVDNAVSATVAGSTLDQSYAPIVSAWLTENAQSVFDTLNQYYTATPAATSS
jgi:hypothetical protein